MMVGNLTLMSIGNSYSPFFLVIVRTCVMSYTIHSTEI